MSAIDPLAAIVAFLESIGMAVEARSLGPDTFLPGVTIEQGAVLYDPERLEWPGDLLHEAGHIAVAPPHLRPSLSDRIPPELLGPHAGEPEATAWAFAATVAIGLPVEVLFHGGGYHGRSAGLAFTYSHGVYPGLAGLAACGMALGPAHAAQAGASPFPAMVRWLRE